MLAQIVVRCPSSADHVPANRAMQDVPSGRMKAKVQQKTCAAVSPPHVGHLGRFVKILKLATFVLERWRGCDHFSDPQSRCVVVDITLGTSDKIRPSWSVPMIIV